MLCYEVCIQCRTKISPLCILPVGLGANLVLTFTHCVSLLILSCVLLYNKYTHNANETYHTVYADQKGKRNP